MRARGRGSENSTTLQQMGQIKIWTKLLFSKRLEVFSRDNRRQSFAGLLHLFLKILQYSQEETPVFESLLNQVAGLRLQHRCFPVNMVKLFKNSFFYRTPLAAASQHSHILRGFEAATLRKSL